MLTRLQIRNFKKFEDVDIPLDNPVLFVGPNNSGKTTALQALALWELGMQRWTEQRPRNGAVISYRDLLATPVLDAKQLWRRLQVRSGRQHVKIEVSVEGRSNGAEWTAGFEFDYANAEVLYARPLGGSAIPEEAAKVRVAYLPPMSGLARDELRLEPGGVRNRIGEGRTAEAIRNLCFQLFERSPESWDRIVNDVERAFGAKLGDPIHIPVRGAFTLAYQEDGIRYDLTSSGRGLLQTTLLLTHVALNPGAVLLLDEPDAHLEIVRQRQIYETLSNAAIENDGQLIIATHSEVLVHKATGRDEIVSFVGTPHSVGQHTSGVHKALRDIGYGDYEQARQAGFVLYLEGSTDFAVLRSLAKRLNHERALRVLDAAFVKPVGNHPMAAVRHVWGLREADPNVRAFALFDRLEKRLPDPVDVPAEVWQRREIENYLSSPSTLEAWAGRPMAEAPDLFVPARRKEMREAIRTLRAAFALTSPGETIEGPDAKVSEDFLPAVFAEWHKRIGSADVMPKHRFHELAEFIPDEDLDPEIKEKLDLIADAYES